MATTERFYVSTKNDMKNYIGRKCKGFRFEDETDNTPWKESMKTFIGELGLIVEQLDDSVRIDFANDWWHYPISLIKEHLIPETPEISQLGEGVDMEVSDDNITWYRRKVIAQMQDGLYIINNGSFWKYARPIQEVKKYTKEELVKIVGHDFEMV
jgi:hypothetical protein